MGPKTRFRIYSSELGCSRRHASIVSLLASARISANIESMILAVSTMSRYGIGGGLPVADTLIEPVNQLLHSRVLIHPPAHDIDGVTLGVYEMLLGTE